MLTKNQKLVFAFGAWAFVALAALTIFNALSYEYFFVVCLIGFIVITVLSGPFTSRPRWRARVNIVILLGVIVFFLIVINKALDILGIKLF